MSERHVIGSAHYDETLSWFLIVGREPLRVPSDPPHLRRELVEMLPALTGVRECDESGKPLRPFPRERDLLEQIEENTRALVKSGGRMFWFSERVDPEDIRRGRELCGPVRWASHIHEVRRAEEFFLREAKEPDDLDEIVRRANRAGVNVELSPSFSDKKLALRLKHQRLLGIMRLRDDRDRRLRSKAEDQNLLDEVELQGRERASQSASAFGRASLDPPEPGHPPRYGPEDERRVAELNREIRDLDPECLSRLSLERLGLPVEKCPGRSPDAMARWTRAAEREPELKGNEKKLRRAAERLRSHFKSERTRP
ncbi:MAG TPA: hypothetical protein VGK70_10160 [Thermoanaerobaculia bacterium]